LDAILVASRFLQFAGALTLLGCSLFCMYGFNAGALPLPALKRRQWPRQTVAIVRRFGERARPATRADAMVFPLNSEAEKSVVS